MWLREGLRLTHWLAPGLASGAARRLYFRPARLRARPTEREVLRSALRSSMQVGGQAVTVRSWGRGPAVLLVHGWSGQLGQLTPLVEPLVSRGYRVVGFDWPGHGESEGRASSLRHVGRVLEALDGLFDGFEAVVAHSFGAAAVTLGLSDGTLRARRVVFFAPAPSLQPYIERFSRALRMGAGQRSAFVEAAEDWLRAPFARFEPLERVLPAIPLLVVHSRDDGEVPLPQVEALVQRWPAAQLHLVDGLGHRRLLADAALVARAADFVARHG